jgi:hypothetical protein
MGLGSLGLGAYEIRAHGLGSLGLGEGLMDYVHMELGSLGLGAYGLRAHGARVSRARGLWTTCTWS